MKLHLVKQLNNTFKVAHDSDYDKMKRIKAGDMLECEVKKPRNLAFHKKFFALINLVFDNQERYSNADDLRYDLTIDAGFFERRIDLDGDEVKKPKSISFAKMDDHEFSELYDAFIRVVVARFGYHKQDLIDNINQYY